MSTVEYNFEIEGMHCPGASLPPNAPDKALHRIRDVRRQQGVSPRSVARKLGMTMQDVRAQEEPTSDLRISQLAAWQQALDVPLADLLVDAEGTLSAPISLRAHLLRVMKTAKAIQQTTQEESISRMSTMLVEQLVDLMPELREVAPWHSVGQRRTQDEMGRIAERVIPDSFFGDE